MTVILLGCGKMGGAMLEGWLDQGIPKESIRVIEALPDHAQSLRDTYNVAVYDSVDQLEAGFPVDFVVLAVKPQMMDAALASTAAYANKATFVSVAAGKTIDYFQSHLGADAAIIRVMPNTPAAVRRGMSAAYANSNVSESHRLLCQDLLSAIGEVAWLKDEGLMDTVTAVSGSGPAYVFHLCEALSLAGQKAGLPQELADQLARVTLSGAGELLRQSPQPAAQLRQNVTSPNGTTQAGLEVLMAEGALQNLMDQCVDAAKQRSIALAKEDN